MPEKSKQLQMNLKVRSYVITLLCDLSFLHYRVHGVERFSPSSSVAIFTVTMVIRYEDILTLVTTIGDQEGLKVTVTQSLKVQERKYVFPCISLTVKL